MTDELTEIDAQARHWITKCQSCSVGSPEWIASRCELGGVMYRREAVLEQRRVVSVLDRFRIENAPSSPGKSFCPQCQKTDVWSNVRQPKFRSCCGTRVCSDCFVDHDECCHEACRTNDMAEIAIAAQEKHQPWALYRMGLLVAKTDMELSAHYFKSAAELDHAVSLYILGMAHASGVNPFLKEDADVASEYLEKAARLGHPESQYRLGVLWLERASPDIKRPKQQQQQQQESFRRGMYWTTLAAATGNADAQAILASLYMNARGGTQQQTLLKPNLERSKYWATQGATHHNHATCQFLLAQAMIILGKQTYQGNLTIAGYSPIPRVVYWLRTSQQNGNDKAGTVLSNVLKSTQAKCANCQKPKITPFGSNHLMACGQCRTTYYCSKQCSVQHWKKGHKRDCVKMPIISKTTSPSKNDDKNDENIVNHTTDTSETLTFFFSDAEGDDTTKTTTTTTIPWSSLGGDSWLDLLN